MADRVLRDPLLVRVEGYWGDEIRITDGGVYLFDVSSQQEIYVGRKVAPTEALEWALSEGVTIDYKAAARWTHAEMVRRGPTDLTWEAAYPEEQADHLFLAFGAIGAALGDAKTTEELHTAAFDALPGWEV